MAIDRDATAEQRSPDWTLPDRFIRDKIDETSTLLEFADEETAEMLLSRINSLFDAEYLIDISARLTTSIPTIYEAEADDEILDIPSRSAALRQRSKFAGTFKGCVSLELKSSPGTRILLYKVAFNDDEGTPVVVLAPADDAKLEFDYPEDETDPEDALIMDAFTTLESFQDEDFQEIAAELQNAYWNTVPPTIVRIRSIAKHATDLLAHPLTSKNPDCFTAIANVLRCSVDYELLHRARGYDVNETRDEAGIPTLEVRMLNKPVVGELIGIDFISDFAVDYSEGDSVKVKPINALQPAIKVRDTNGRSTYVMPLQYMAVFEEWEKDQALDTGDTYVVSGPIGKAAVSGAFQTHGEWYHAYKREYEAQDDKRSGTEG